MRSLPRLVRSAFVVLGAAGVGYGIWMQVAEAQSDDCGIPMARDETTGVVHLLAGGACPTAPCMVGGSVGTCFPIQVTVPGTGGPEIWNACACVHIADNGDGTFTTTWSNPFCLEAFKPFGGEDPPTEGMGRCLARACPMPCLTYWRTHPEDPEVASIECQCPGVPGGGG